MSEINVNVEEEVIPVVEIIIDENSALAAREAVEEARTILEELKSIDVSNKLDKGGYIGTAKNLYDQSKIYENGQLQIFRKPDTVPDPTNTLPNIGDICVGFVEGQFITAPYLGGNPLLLASFDI